MKRIKSVRISYCPGFGRWFQALVFVVNNDTFVDIDMGIIDSRDPHFQYMILPVQRSLPMFMRI